MDKKGQHMAYETYFGSKPVSDWTANGSAEEGHNFIDRINQQAQDIEAGKNQYNEQKGVVGSAQTAYDDAYKNQQGYGDLYKQAKDSEGVDDAKAQYQKSLASVNATQSAMNNLPSSINAGSNVVLNASQRNAALRNQMSKFQNTLDYQTRQNAGDLSQYQTALSAAQNLAGNLRNDEVTNVSQAMTNLQAQMDYANKLYEDVLREKEVMHSIYGQMFDDEYQHMQNEIEVWAKNLQSETERYAQEQETARNNAKIAAQNYATDVSKYLNSGYYWDGSKWTTLNPAEVKPYISSTGNYYTPQTGTGYVDPIKTTVNGNNVNAYVASPEMLANLMYGRQ